MKMLWKLWGRIEKYYKISADQQAFAVLGFPRSGTSLVSRLIEKCGISFGDPRAWKAADWRNPSGFYEYTAMLKIDERLAKQCGFQSPYGINDNATIRAQGWWQRFLRLVTRIRMMALLKSISRHGKRWAFKEFPLTFYFWKDYIPNIKIIAVFRDPRANADSVVRTFKRHTFRQVLAQWTAANKELIYHLAKHDSILIQLEDLADPSLRKIILQKLVAFTGNGSVTELETIIASSAQEIKQRKMPLIEDYPLSPETEALFAALKRIKTS